MFRQWKVSVVIPAYNEEGTIESVVRDFRAHPDVDEVLVVDNNCRDRTAELARAAGARVVAESAAGYGCALKRGMDEAAGDVFVLVEADGSFRAHDLAKFLCYLPDCSMVLGTRTTRQMVQQGANMDALLRWGNVAAAKILELFWFLAAEPRITDVGCTYRALHRATWHVIRDGLDRDRRAVLAGDDLRGLPVRAPGHRDPDPLLLARRRRIEAQSGLPAGRPNRAAHAAHDLPEAPRVAGAPGKARSSGGFDRARRRSGLTRGTISKAVEDLQRLHRRGPSG